MRCRLGDIVATNRNTYSPKDEWIYVNYLDTGSIVSNIITNVEYIDLKTNTLPSRAKRKVQVNSIIYSTVRPNQLHYGIVKTPYQNFLVSTGFVVIDVDNNKADADYVYYLLTQKATVTYLQNIAEQSVSAYPSIKPSDIEDIEIYLPDLTTQKQVSTLLRTFDEKMNLLSQINHNLWLYIILYVCDKDAGTILFIYVFIDYEEINHNLEEQAKAIFKSWFIDYEPFGGVMPEDWQFVALDEVAEIGAGGDKPKEISSIKTTQHPYPIYSNGLADNGLYGYTDKATIFDESITVSARGTIGFVCLRQTPYLPIVRLITLRAKTKIITGKYLYLWLKQLHIIGTGTTQQQLTIPDFQKTQILLPPLNIILAYTAIVNALFEKIQENQRQISALTTLRDTLLPKLMSGEIDVSAVEIGR